MSGSRTGIAAVDPALREATRRLPVPDVRRRWARSAARLGVRLMPAARVGGVAVRDVRAGGARVRVYRPESVRSSDHRPGLLWVHGGGFVLGAARQDDRLCAGTAAELGITVVSAEYRLAPEHPFPAPLDDVAAAWGYVQAEAGALGVDGRRVAVGGQSAGGGLAAALVQRLHDDPAAARPVAQWLFAPMLDDRTAADRRLDAVGHPVWDNAANRYGWRAYLGGEPGRPDAPAGAVPARRDDLSGLPPAWLECGGIELFHDEDVEYARRLRAAGVPVELLVVPGAPHGFETWAAGTGPADATVAAARAWLAGALAA